MMSFTHAVVWLDQGRSRITHFQIQAGEAELSRAYASQPYLHIGSEQSDSPGGYFGKIVYNIQDAVEILLLGPGTEKNKLMKYISLHHRCVGQKIVGIVDAVQLTDDELQNFSRRYFANMDQLAAIARI